MSGAMLAVAGAAKATQAILGGLQKRNSYKIQQYQLQTQKKAIQANAALEQAQRLNNLNSILSTQRAVMASRGQTAGFGSAMVIQQEAMNQAAIEQMNSNTQDRLSIMAADYNIASAKKAASSAVFSSVVSGALDFAGDVAMSYATNSFSEVPNNGGGNK